MTSAPVPGVLLPELLLELLPGLELPADGVDAAAALLLGAGVGPLGAGVGPGVSPVASATPGMMIIANKVAITIATVTNNTILLMFIVPPPFTIFLILLRIIILC
ncbi:MAG: hypothetical protein ACYDGS_06500 [Thermoleophilia bacterium]